MDEVIIVGAGVGGLTLGLALHAAGIPCRVFESASEIKLIGVGINLLPHATKELAALGLEQALAQAAIATKDATFFNRFGKLIYQEPLGRAAGYDHPQFSIHRGDLQMVLLDAFLARAGHEARDIDEFNNGRNHALGFDDIGERGQPRIRHFDHADIRLDRAERVVFGGDAGLGQCIEQCGLADVRQADDAALEAHGILRTGETACAAWFNAGRACRGFYNPQDPRA